MTSWGNNYKLTQKLGKGSFASVYKAVDERTGETVAIKVISIERIGNDQRLHQNLMSEIDIMKNYKHSCICQLRENFSSSKHISLVLQYCAGGDLQKFIRKTTRLSESVTRKFLVQLAAGLGFLHEKNIIHRDIKSQNILLSVASSDAQLKIADFGFAKHLEEAAMAHSVCGTPLYMAPEVFDRREYDSKVDIWSMGCVVYEMLTGYPPFRGSNPHELFKNIRDAKSLDVPQDVAISEDMMKLLRNTLERDPAKRSSLSDFVECSNILGTNPSFQEIGKPASTAHTTPAKSVLYSPAPATNLSTEDNSKKRVQSADSSKAISGTGAARRHSEGGYGWSHSPPIPNYSPAKSVTASGNTSSALAAAWAAIGLLGGSTNPSSSAWKSSSPGNTGTPKKRLSVNSPYGTSPAKSSTNSISLTTPRPSSMNSGSEDFVMIDRLPNRPWRATESESVPSCGGPNQQAYSPPQGEEICDQRNGHLNAVSSSSSSSISDCNYVDDRNESDGNDELQLAQFVSSLSSYSEYLCSIVCAITQVADNLVTQVCNSHQTSVMKNENSVYLSTIPQDSPLVSSGLVVNAKKCKNGASYPEILKNAMSLYLHVLGIMRDMMKRVAVSKKTLPIGANKAYVEVLNKLSEGLSLRFKVLLDRAENCSNLMSNQYKIEERDKAVHNAEPIMYYTAMELAKEASVSAILGNLDQACAQYELARLLIERLLMTAESASDKKILQSFVEMFMHGQEEIKKNKCQFTPSDDDTKYDETAAIDLLNKSTLHLAVTK